MDLYAISEVEEEEAAAFLGDFLLALSGGSRHLSRARSRGWTKKRGRYLRAR